MQAKKENSSSSSSNRFGKKSASSTNNNSGSSSTASTMAATIAASASSSNKMHNKKTNSSKSKSKKTPSSPSSGAQQMRQQQQQQSHHQQQPINVVAQPAASLTTTKTSPSGSSYNNDISKDKTNYKNYAGLSGRTVKVIWEQHDKTETEIDTEVFSRLADDTTHKLWELANNLKTYSRHSGGKVTADLVNEVLKDSDVPPTTGAGTTNSWDKIEYDGTYFFPHDEVLNLRNEYLREISTVQCGPLVLVANWWAEKRSANDLNQFARSLLDAIFLGDEVAFQYGCHTVQISPYIGCIIRPLITRCLQLLAIEYSDDTLSRILRTLSAVAGNLHARETGNNDQLYHLCQLLTCLMLGPLDLNVGMAQYKKDEQECKQREEEYKQREEQINSIAAELQSIKEESTVDSVGVVGSGVVIYPTMDVDECEALLQLMENEGFEPPTDFKTITPVKIKQEETATTTTSTAATDSKMFDIKTEKMVIDDGVVGTDTTTTYKAYNNINTGGGGGTIKQEDFMETNADFNVKNIKMESTYEDDYNNVVATAAAANGGNTFMMPSGCEEKLSTLTDGGNDGDDDGIDVGGDADADDSECEQFSALTTLMCDEKSVDDCCRLIGHLSAKWGYLEREIIYIVARRLEIFFHNSVKLPLDYVWLTRVVRLLWTLGDYAFRELTVFFEKIDTLLAPDWIQCYFNAGAIYINGREDIFLYEYMYDLCGDSLMPFMIYYSKYLLKLSRRVRRRRQLQQQRPTTALMSRIHITPKLVLRSMPAVEPPMSRLLTTTVSDAFPQKSEMISRKFAFKVAGFCPVSVKSRNKSLLPHRQPAPPPMQTYRSVTRNCINQSVVICKRKLMKPIRSRANVDHWQDNIDFHGLIL